MDRVRILTMLSSILKILTLWRLSEPNQGRLAAQHACLKSFLRGEYRASFEGSRLEHECRGVNTSSHRYFVSRPAGVVKTRNGRTRSAAPHFCPSARTGRGNKSNYENDASWLLHLCYYRGYIISIMASRLCALTVAAMAVRKGFGCFCLPSECADR